MVNGATHSILKERKNKSLAKIKLDERKKRKR